jgi:hypothetical protein
MLQKIISSGLNSAARAALDVALHLDIDHGGWISTGDVSAHGRTASSYSLQELPSNLDCMEKCVTNADGTLLLTRGEIDGELKAFRDFAQKNGRHFLHIDLERVPAFKASTVIADWLVHHKVDVLNVAGSGSDAPDSYEKIFHVITSAYWLTQAKIDEASAQELRPDKPWFATIHFRGRFPVIDRYVFKRQNDNGEHDRRRTHQSQFYARLLHPQRVRYLEWKRTPIRGLSNRIRRPGSAPQGSRDGDHWGVVEGVETDA